MNFPDSPTRAARTRVEATSAADLAALLWPVVARHGGLVAMAGQEAQSLTLRIRLSDAGPGTIPFGSLLDELDRQGQLVRLLHLHLARSQSLVARFDEPATDLLHVGVPRDTPTAKLARLASVLDDLLEATAQRRIDALLRPWSGRPAPPQSPWAERGNCENEEPAARVDARVTLVNLVGLPQELARLDEGLQVYDDDEAAEVGHVLARLLQPFDCGRSLLRIGGRVIALREMCVPAEGQLARGLAQACGRVALARRPGGEPRLPVDACDGSGAASWLLGQALRRVLTDSGLAPDAAGQSITLVPPHTDPASVPLQSHGVIVDLFGSLPLRQTPQLSAMNIVVVRGAALWIGEDPFVWRTVLRDGGLDPAALEAVLLALDDADGIEECNGFAGRATRRGLRLGALAGPWGTISAAQWQAFEARRQGRLASWRAHADSCAGHPPLAAPPTGPLNLCDLVFSPAHLASGSRLTDPGRGEALDYAGLQRRASALAARLQALGVPSGEVIAFAGTDGLAAASLLLACCLGGWVFSPLHAALPPAAFDGLLRGARPWLLLCEQTVAELHAAVLATWSWLPLDAFLADLPTSSYPIARLRADAPAVLLFTSGSTGSPKAVVHTHADFIQCSRNYGPHVLGLQPQDCVYTPSRIFFAYRLNNLLMSLMAGASHVLAAPLPEGKGLGDTLARHRVSVFLAVPVFFQRLLAEACRPLPSLRLCVSAGENLPAALYRSLHARLGVDVLDGIGNTESISTFISNRPGCVAPGCTGVPVPGFEMRLVDDQGRPCRIGEPGRLWVRGDTLAHAYRGDAATSALHFVDGWFDTQDMFFMDASRRFHHMGRAGSVVKINACWFSPQLLEITLQQHPAVRDCAVCLLPNELGLPHPHALVVVEPAHAPPGDVQALWRELRTLSCERLGRHHSPHAFAAVGDLPRTSSGKLMRSALVTHFNQGALAQ